MYKLLRHLRLGLLAVGCATMTACAPPSKPIPILKVDGERTLATTGEIVAIGPRPSGSKGAQRTVEYIVNRGHSLGYKCHLMEWDEETAYGERRFRNVYAEYPGATERYIILASHYDTKRMDHFHGANDGASSTALLLELMRVIAANGPWHGYSLVFVFFDGEEAVGSYSELDGLHGSRKMAKDWAANGRLRDCRAMILMDMVGDADLTVTIPTDNDRILTSHVMKAAKAQGVRSKFGFFLYGTILDDHKPFMDRGVAAIDLIDFEYGPNNSYWHTPQDTMDKLSATSLETVGNVVLQVIAELE